MIITYYQLEEADAGPNLGQWETFIVQPYSTGGVFINPQSWAIPNNFTPYHANDAAAEAYLDGFFPQPPWRKVKKP